MKVILSGGGSGGHVTPILAVADELKKRSPGTEVIYIGQLGDPFGDIPKEHGSIDKVYFVRAGKFRRFHGEGIRQLLDLPILYKNIKDFFNVIIGTYQSYKIVKEIKPDVLFTRGGYVSVPVAFGAKLNGVNYITHDSDPIPSLANRIIARGASFHAVALPKDIYPYPQDKTFTTGIPLSTSIKKVDDKLKRSYRKDINAKENAKILFVTGGGLGSQRLNEAVGFIAEHLLDKYSDLYIYQVTGNDNLAEVEKVYDQQINSDLRGRIKSFGYIDHEQFCKYSGAADIIVSRAGATNLAEFAIQGKATIIVPSKFLAGGHQVKNAQYLEAQGACLVVDEDRLYDNPLILAKEVSDLLDHPVKISSLEKNISKFAISDAANTIADLVIELGEKKGS
ncbi:MAG TPA: UDP-N-acetylglucosamine--N-acetylmuramyl-(pentapeptide) pyrophosphoryl-undecaprenol N-acetylglucosamine transferase [Candidatus Sulfotelmatobacter sp.]|nr:UDP-N-acetylglucosamine--N-acetylmuramyl-(pentapeptide) pyrophosphoryl-undecaprenol N-acetylglucosamine transferase [Candidatus Sulfotelmatobacter sp.]